MNTSKWEGLLSLANVPIEADVKRVRQQIVTLLRSEPPPSSVKAIYFGLFDAVADDGSQPIGYYLAGVDGFDAADKDCLCNPTWWPEGRYLTSRALDAVKEAEVVARNSGRDNDHALIGYAGQLGAALLISRFASTGLFPGLRRVVGFDSGDIAEIQE